MNPIEMSILMIFHPTDAFDEIKIRAKKLSFTPGIVVLILLLLVRYLYVIFVHIPLTDIRIHDTSVLLEAGRILLPIITLVFSIYAVESIMNGERNFRMIFMAVTYSFVPYILITPVMILLSHILSREDSSLFGSINNGMWIWIAVLIFTGIIYMNNYTFGKALRITFLSIIGVVLIWGIAIMMAAMSVQLFDFLGELYKEYILYNF